EETDRPRSAHHDALARDQAAQDVEPVHRGAGGDHQRRLGVAHVVGHMDERVDVVDGVLGEAAIGGEAVGAVALLRLAVIEARGVHALAAALAAAAAGMHLDGDAIAHLILVDGGPEFYHGAHVFVAGREILVEGQAALDLRRDAVADDLEVGGAHSNGVDAHQHLGRSRLRHRLVRQRNLLGIAQYPGLHAIGNRVLIAALTTAHSSPPTRLSALPAVVG